MDFYIFKLILATVVLHLSRTTHAQMSQILSYCEANSSDITFKNNLQSLFQSITTGAQANGGYFKDTIGTGFDSVYGHAICYIDSDLTKCNGCLASLADNITSKCPDSRNAGFWDQSGPCFIRYSDVSFFGEADTSNSLLLRNINNSSDPESFLDARNKLFDNLIARTNASTLRFGAAEQNVTKNETLYGMTQCTRDLSREECYKCLNKFIQDLQEPGTVYQYTVGARYFGPSCFLHYEIGPLLYVHQVIPFVPSPAPDTAPSPKPLSPNGPAPGIGAKLPKKSNRTIIIAVVGTVTIVLAIITICIWISKWWYPFSRKGTSELIKTLEEVAASEFLIYDLTTIRNATNNFSDKNLLGKGGFGQVYKGTLLNGREIAVKRLSTSSTHGAIQFKTEVESLVRLRHKNLVKLLGCCISEQERILCYEYLPNGSLDNILFGNEDIRYKELNWSRRFRIIKGTCHGLLYLHEESPLKIVHRDLKASNILLDRDMNPKIADFGLARLFDRDQTHTVTDHLAGTFGYIAPECSTRGTCSAKSDTYSFGILLLEIVLGRNNSSFPGSMFTSGLISYVWKHWSEGKVRELKDPTLDEECMEEVTKCIHIALLCLQVNPSNRPDMETVANMLNSSSIVSLPPLPPPKFIWGADVSSFEDDEHVDANSSSREYTVVGVETGYASFLSSFNHRA